MRENTSNVRVKWRSIICVTSLLTLCLAIQAMMTRILGLGLVCMVQNMTTNSDSTLFPTHTSDFHNQFAILTTKSSVNHVTLSKIKFKHRKIVWDYKIQSHVLAAHDWGELLALPISAFVVNNNNLNLVLVTSVLCSILFTGLFPVITDQFDSTGAFVGRLSLGMARAFSTPALDACVAMFIPEHLRNVVYSIVLSGNQLASIVVNTLVAYYCHVEVWNFSGWQISFFVLCVLGILWTVIWLRLRPRMGVNVEQVPKVSDSWNLLVKKYL